jgi:hypothetical protein
MKNEKETRYEKKKEKKIEIRKEKKRRKFARATQTKAC